MKMSSLFTTLLALALCLALLGQSGVDARGARTAPAAPFVVPANASTADLVAAVCGMSNRKDLCLSSLQSIPDVGSAPDVGVLAITALKAATSDASNTSAVIQGLLNDTTLAPTVQQALSDCADHYIDAVEQLDDSVAALTVKAYPDVRKWVKVAIAAADGCEAGFQQVAAGPNILSHRNLIFRQLCNNALGIVKLLKA